MSDSIFSSRRTDVLAMFIVTGIIFASCVACSPRAAPLSPRSAPEQHAATVQITVICLTGDVDEPLSGHYGTGVIVSDHRVLTAAHVASCHDDHGEPKGKMFAMVAKTQDGVDHQMGVEVLMPGIDVARIATTDVMVHAPIRLGAYPRIGDRVCESAAVPRSTYRCGTVQAVDDTHVEFDMFTEFGNSGSALYAADGRLVGIVTNAQYCQDDHMCAGLAANLNGLDWLIPE